MRLRYFRWIIPVMVRTCLTYDIPILGFYIIAGRMEPNDYHHRTYGTGFVMKTDDDMKVLDVKLIRSYYNDADQYSDSVACTIRNSTSTTII